MKLKKIVKQVVGLNNILKIRDFIEQFSHSSKELVSKRKAFYNQFVNKNDLCFDVGANIGNRITPMLEIGARVLAVEPQDSCQKYLKWKFGSKITLITKGLAEKECVRTFHINKNVTAISSFSDEWINSVKEDRFKENTWDETVDVEMTTLDKLIEQYGIPVFIKIDVEGYELEVLSGLSQEIKMISFEFTVPEQTNKIIDCVKVIEKNNPDIVCNYSIGESMEWAHTKWLPVSEFLALIQTSAFISYGFGDVYIKLGKS